MNRNTSGRSPDGLRPDWDAYFLGLCERVAANSKCLSRKIGAVLVRDNVVICTGYNGPPRGVPHCHAVGPTGLGPVCPRRAAGYASGEGLHLCPAAHAERNCIAQAARLGIQTKGATLYLNFKVPCKDCLGELINAGIREVVCTDASHYDELGKWMLDQLSPEVLSIRTFDIPTPKASVGGVE